MARQPAVDPDFLDLLASSLEGLREYAKTHGRDAAEMQFRRVIPKPAGAPVIDDRERLARMAYHLATDEQLHRQLLSALGRGEDPRRTAALRTAALRALQEIPRPQDFRGVIKRQPGDGAVKRLIRKFQFLTWDDEKPGRGFDQGFWL